MLAFPKPRPVALERQDRRAQRLKLDRAENEKVRSRSMGQCEVMVHQLTFAATKSQPAYIVLSRCQRRGHQTHHMIGGWGKRARGISILAEHKQYVCQRCHDDIGGHVLQRIGGDPPRWTDAYRRLK